MGGGASPDFFIKNAMKKKVLLHTHIEGSIPRSTLSELCLKNKVDFPFDINTTDFRSVIDKNDWNTFRKIFYALCNCFQTEEDYYSALFNYGLSIKKNNVIYAEVKFSPWRHISRNISMDIIYRGFERAVIELERNHNVAVRLICDFVRNQNENAAVILDWLICNKKDSYITGAGNSGGTGAVPRKNYQDVFFKLKDSGYKITAHAGELEPPDSIFEAIDCLYADRIGHGITIVDHPQLMEKLKTRNIHFELCPSANDFIGLGKPNFQSIKEMLLLAKNCSINTDDELIFQTNIENEYQLLLQNNIISENDIMNLNLNALENSFLNTAEKMRIRDRITP